MTWTEAPSKWVGFHPIEEKASWGDLWCLMHTHIGLWIDHRRAVIVSPSKLNEEITTIQSEAERHLSRAKDAVPGESFEAQRVLADDVQDRKFKQHLQGYYDEVITALHGATSLFIFGPGEAKGELAKRLALEKPSTRSLHVESADKMTDGQIAAKVREHFYTNTPTIASR